MPGMPAVHPDEAENLLAYLRQQRDGLRYAAYGLTDEQARAAPTASTLSVGGLVKHCTFVEGSWRDVLLQREPGPDDGAGEQGYEQSFALAADEDLGRALAAMDRGEAATEEAVRALPGPAGPDLGAEVPLPPAPWNPPDLTTVSARWVLVHLVEELARHAGHADVVREHVDGATMYALMAGVEGWPDSDWLHPWHPPPGVRSTWRPRGAAGAG